MEHNGEDIKDLQSDIETFKIAIEDFNNIVGYIGSFKGEFNIFKVKQFDKEIRC